MYVLSRTPDNVAGTPFAAKTGPTGNSSTSLRDKSRLSNSAEFSRGTTQA